MKVDRSLSGVERSVRDILLPPSPPVLVAADVACVCVDVVVDVAGVAGWVCGVLAVDVEVVVAGFLRISG